MMIEPPGEHDRLLGVVCLIACPTISGLFLGFVAGLCAFPVAGAHAITIGAIVGACAFTANAVAICLTAVAAEGRARRRAAHALTLIEIPRVPSEPTPDLVDHDFVVARAYEALGRRS
jgi:hypothetical protein